MQWYAHTDSPLSLHGAANVRFERIEHRYAAQVSERVENMARRTPGGRIRFATNSETIAVQIEYAKALEVDKNMSLLGASGADVYIGSGFDAQFIGVIRPESYDAKIAQAELKLPKGMRTVTINLPRNTPLSTVRVGVEDHAKMIFAPPYTIKTPILFYGSSITEGGCALRPSMAYTALVSRWLDADFRNLGFSGAARGEDAMAEYIIAQPMSALVYDYDHNAPDPEFLQNTHEPFFKKIRAARPELPILMLSRPDTDSNPDEAALRRDIIRATYENAKAAGDKLVRFIDGHTFFDGPDRSFCTVDTCHPTDLGFYRMAQKVYPVLCEMLGVPNLLTK